MFAAETNRAGDCWLLFKPSKLWGFLFICLQMGQHVHLVFEKATHSSYESNQNILMCSIAVGTSKWGREMQASVRGETNGLPGVRAAEGFACVQSGGTHVWVWL